MPRIYENLNVESDFGGRFPWKSQRIAVGDGVDQAVIDEGPRTAPVTFVLLHGNPYRGFLYRKFVAAPSKDYGVVVPTTRAFTRASTSAYRPSAPTPSAAAPSRDTSRRGP